MDAGMPNGSSDGNGREHLLPGEKADSTDPDDARHWVAVYRELLRGLRQLRRTAAADAQARLRAIAGRYARRLAHWRRRAGPRR